MDRNDRFDVFTYERYYAHGVCIVKEGDNTVYMSESNDEYVKQVYPPDPDMVATQTTYFADTLTVSGEGCFLKGWNVEIGVWRSYDQNGDLIREVNKDEHYPIPWIEMITHFRVNDINVRQIRLLRRTLDQDSGRYLWALTLKAPYGTLDMALFDAATGELVSRKQTQIIVS